MSSIQTAQALQELRGKRHFILSRSGIRVQLARSQRISLPCPNTLLQLPIDSGRLHAKKPITGV